MVLYYKLDGSSIVQDILTALGEALRLALEKKTDTKLMCGAPEMKSPEKRITKPVSVSKAAGGRRQKIDSVCVVLCIM